jgi:hypothetical protein
MANSRELYEVAVAGKQFRAMSQGSGVNDGVGSREFMLSGNFRRR